MYLPITLASAAVAAIISIWLMVRIGRVRLSEKVLHGDGGKPMLQKRMRAQLNFVETAPFVLILIAVIEASGRDGMWLTIMAALYWIGRVCHPIGMDSDTPHKLRVIGTGMTMATLLVLGIVAVLLASGVLPPKVETLIPITV